MDIDFKCITSPLKSECYVSLEIIISIYFANPQLETMLENNIDF